MRTPHEERCVLGLASMQNVASAKEPLTQFVTWFGERADVSVDTKFVDSYGALARLLHEGEVQIAWLPPVVFVALQKAKIVDPLVSNHRAGHAAFHSALVVHADSGIKSLYGLTKSRVAWVDPYSASGYVLPRIQLNALGFDPRTLFTEEKFVGSHDAAIDAVLYGEADVAGTFARVDGAGLVSSGSWSQLQRARSMIKVLTVFGTIPSDVIAVHRDVPEPLRVRLRDAFVAASFDSAASVLVRRLFGVEEFRRGSMLDYTGLRNALEQASKIGLLDALDLNIDPTPEPAPGPATDATSDADATIETQATIDAAGSSADATIETDAIPESTKPE